MASDTRAPDTQASESAAAAARLLQAFKRLLGEGLSKAGIARRLGFRTTVTLDAQLRLASQRSGKPVPRPSLPKGAVREVQVKPRGRGTTFGVHIPAEPLARLGAKPGDRLAVTTARHRIVLRVVREEKAAEPGPRQPRLVKGRRRP